MRTRFGTGGAPEPFVRASRAQRRALLGDRSMSSGIVWRTVLFFGLTAGYTMLAALPYLS